ncbi:beta strand repeat-containing protein [Denitratisoma sp. DHT3]|uniref:beta strand repeat-containing protein n=1 Tax=Denitratisoma sp. DHT3 TaxID=1981880 RepID=UPI00164544C1|nr:filamentous hemagglutinin N-terminal domain-containing protein [Denitratisoma sp. DHT3]
MALAIASCFAAPLARALPVAPQVVAGSATFSQSGNTLSITNVPGTIINWQSFSVAPLETARFLQQTNLSAVLNRVTGPDASQILGALQSNGRVYLINPNGIAFGPGARVDTQGLIASTLNISDKDFLAGRLNFEAGAVAGGIRNEGVLQTPSGGAIYLVAPDIENAGIIRSPQGEVILAAGGKVQLVEAGRPDIQVVVSAPADKAVNLGQIVTEAGRTGLFGAVLQQKGLISADTAGTDAQGRIVFRASKSVSLEAGSVTTANGNAGGDITLQSADLTQVAGTVGAAGSEGKGGSIQVLGDKVALIGNAVVDASGRSGGGTILVGGDYQGKSTQVQNASVTYFGKDARIRADATRVGDGGKVIVWADDTTRAYGSISAKGGVNGGDGGFVETSGKKYLDYHARVDVGAAAGRGGTLLLDPATITLVGGSGEGAASPDGNTTFQGGATPGTVNFADGDITSAGVSNIYQSELQGLSPGTNIILEATDYIGATGTFGNLLILPNNSNLTMRTRNASTDGSGTIGINLANSTDSSNLEIRTQGSGTITLQTGTGSSPQMATIDAGKLTTGGGQVTVNATGNVVIRGITTTPISTGAGGDINLTSGGYMTLGGANIDARGNSGTTGNVTLNSGGAISVQTSKTIYGNNLKMAATGGITDGASGAVSTQVAKLDNIHNMGSGDVRIANSGALSFDDTVTLGYGVKQESSGVLEIVVASGALTVDKPIIAASSATLSGASITQTTDGAITADHVDLLANAGSVALNVAANSVNSLAGSASGNIAFKNGKALSVSSLSSSSSGQTINLETTSGGLSVGTITASGGTVTLTTAGSIIDANASGTNVTASTLTVNAANGLSLDTAVSSLSATNTASNANGIGIRNTGNLTVTALSDSSVCGATPPATTCASTAGTALSSDDTLTISGNVAAGAGPVTLKAPTIASTGPVTAGNHLAIIADNISFGATMLGKCSASGSAGCVDIKPLTSGRSIEIAGATNSDALSITQSDLAKINPASSGITGGSILIGDGSGPITFTGDFTAPGGMYSNLRGTTISQSAGTTIHGMLDAIASGAITLTQSTNEIDHLGYAFKSSGSTIEVTTSVPSLVLMGTVRAASGLTIANNGGDIVVDSAQVSSVYSGSTTLSASGGITIKATSADSYLQGNPDVYLTLGGDIAFTAPSSFKAYVSPTQPTTTHLTFTSAAGKVLFNGTQATATTSGNMGFFSTPGFGGTPAVVGSSLILTSGSADNFVAPSSGGGGATTPPPPTLDACIANPALSGCTSVLPTLSSCTTNPTQAGCTAVLPSLSSCTTNPTQAGCAAVLPSLSSCTTNPAQAGCTAVLPSLSSCTTNPAQAGCTAVLPSLSSCTTNPAQAGCTAVLPSLSSCTTNPAQAGCTAVLPSLSSCTTDPAQAGCTAVLPSLSSCTTDPTQAGCAAVLPSLSSCTTNPAQAGCTAVLPSLSSCTANPTQAGCTAVLPSLSTCTTSPTSAGCSAVLPTLSACTTAPTTAGCSAVLPSLDSCTTAPTTAGCSVVLPSLASCVTNPSLAGCSAVLPSSTQSTIEQLACLVGSTGCSGGSDSTVETITTQVSQTEQSIAKETTVSSTQPQQLAGGGGGGGAPFGVASGNGSGSGSGQGQPSGKKNEDDKDKKADSQQSGAASEGTQGSESNATSYCN